MTQAQIMAHGEERSRRPPEERAAGEELMEESFLKDLYLFMKKRDTPIERIPHLGFKQIDLFVMYKTVKDSGGYHQVTAQQLWKQIYNTLGGNPRSTSAATCTRRHYEKLLLPYECHVKGGDFLVLSPRKQLHYNNLDREDECPRALKTPRPLLLPLPQNPRRFMPGSLRVLPLPVHYPHFYHPSHPGLPPYMPMPPPSLPTQHGPQVPQVPQPQVSYLHPSTERSKEPLERLRYLAEQYKSSSGLAEPLNLSTKGTGSESSGHPASSFTSPPASKNPKFLNQPSPLYPPKGVAKNEECDAQEKDAAPGKYSSVPLYPQYLRDSASYVIDLTSTSSSRSPTPGSGLARGTDSMSPVSLPCNRKVNCTATHVRSSPKRDFTAWPEEEKEENAGLSQRALGHGCGPPTPPGENGDNMEVQIPLSVLQTWIKLCGTSTSRHGTFPLPIPTQEADTRDGSSNTDISATRSNRASMIFHSLVRDQDRSSAIDNLTPRQRNTTSPTPTPFSASDHHSTPSYRLPSCQLSSMRPGGNFKSESGQDAYPLDGQEGSKPYYSSPAEGWDPYGCQAPRPVQLKRHSFPLVGGPKPPAYSEEASSSVVHLTREELMKLKRIISSSS